MVSPALSFELARQVRDYARWRAVPESDRAPAPGWWWGPAFAARNVAAPLPDSWAPLLGLPSGASYADAAALFMSALAGQHSLAWPAAFPGQGAATSPQSGMPTAGT